MKVSTRGLAEIASHEGIVNYPYFDSVRVRTVGIGHTANAGPPDPSRNLRTFTVPEIMEIFARDIAKFEKRVNAAFKRPLSQAQFDAAVSFDFNTGGIHRASWVKHFNAGNMAAAKKAFMNWSKPKEIIPRRQKERDLFFNGTYSSGGYANLYPATASGKVLWSKGKRVNVLAMLAEANKPAQRVPEPPTTTTPPKPKTAPVKPQGSKTGIVAGAIAIVSVAIAAIVASVMNIAAGICEMTGLFCG